MKKQSIQRRVKQACPGNQLLLLLPGGSPASADTSTSAGSVIFNDPDPQALYVGGSDLHTHL